jgi:hypothetical protein
MVTSPANSVFITKVLPSDFRIVPERRSPFFNETRSAKAMGDSREETIKRNETLSKKRHMFSLAVWSWVQTPSWLAEGGSSELSTGFNPYIYMAVDSSIQDCSDSRKGGRFKQRVRMLDRCARAIYERPHELGMSKVQSNLSPRESAACLCKTNQSTRFQVAQEPAAGDCRSLPGT